MKAVTAVGVSQAPVWVVLLLAHSLGCGQGGQESSGAAALEGRAGGAADFKVIGVDSHGDPVRFVLHGFYGGLGTHETPSQVLGTTLKFIAPGEPVFSAESDEEGRLIIQASNYLRCNILIGIPESESLAFDYHRLWSGQSGLPRRLVFTDGNNLEWKYIPALPLNLTHHVVAYLGGGVDDHPAFVPTYDGEVFTMKHMPDFGVEVHVSGVGVGRHISRDENQVEIHWTPTALSGRVVSSRSEAVSRIRFALIPFTGPAADLPLLAQAPIFFYPYSTNDQGNFTAVIDGSASTFSVVVEGMVFSSPCVLDLSSINRAAVEIRIP